MRSAAKALREVGEDFVRGTYAKIQKGEPFPDAMFSYVLKEIHEAGRHKKGEGWVGQTFIFVDHFAPIVSSDIIIAH